MIFFAIIHLKHAFVNIVYYFFINLINCVEATKNNRNCVVVLSLILVDKHLLTVILVIFQL
jgi:hypothetical protein